MKEFHDPTLLAEIDLLFAPDGMIDVAGDVRWNCYAKAFVTMWLLQLWGEQSQSYEGRLCVVSFSAKEKIIQNVCPHAWAGLSEHKIFDMSMRNVGGTRYLTVIGGHVAEDSNWHIYVEKDPTNYERIASGCISNAEHRFLVYYPEKVRQFSANSIQDKRATFSPSTRRILEQYQMNLLPRAVLHLFLFAEDKIESLSQRHITSPWDELERWEVDATHELNSLLE